jgi:hypothetical protein
MKNKLRFVILGIMSALLIACGGSTYTRAELGEEITDLLLVNTEIIEGLYIDEQEQEQELVIDENGEEIMLDGLTLSPYELYNWQFINDNEKMINDYFDKIDSLAQKKGEDDLTTRKLADVTRLLSVLGGELSFVVKYSGKIVDPDEFNETYNIFIEEQQIEQNSLTDSEYTSLAYFGIEL